MTTPTRRGGRAKGATRADFDRPLTDEQSELAAGHFAFARKLARPFKAKMPWLYDEFESAATLALVTSSRNYDPSMGMPFTTFAYRRIIGALSDVCRDSRPKGFRRPSGSVPEIVHLGFDHESDADPVGTELDDADSFRSLTRPLPEKHRRAVELHYLHDQTLDEVGRTMGVSQSWASRLVNLSHEWLRHTASVPA